MSTEFHRTNSYFRLSLRGDESDFPALIDVSSFLYDFNLLYEVARLATDEAYQDYAFSSPQVYYRFGRPLRDEDKLRIERLRHESPIALITVLVAAYAAIPAIWGLVQIMEKIVNFPLNRRKLRAEVEKLERENREAQHLPTIEIPENPEFFLRQLHLRGADEISERITDRLRQSSVRITEFDVEVVKRFPRG
jgi:hypothetical protein